MYKHFFLFCLLAILATTARAQQPDTSAVKNAADTGGIKQNEIKSPVFLPKVGKEKQYHPDSTHSPRKAVMHSLMVPGWGQAYNRKWWKVPIVYTGLGLLGAAIVFNQKYYSEFLAIAKYRRNGAAPGPNDKYYAEYQAYATAPDSFIEGAVNSYRRNRDLSILGTLGAWGIQMVDAYIDAKFMHSYTMDNNLSFKVTPSLMGQPMYAADFNSAFIPAIKVTFTF